MVVERIPAAPRVWYVETVKERDVFELLGLIHRGPVPDLGAPLTAAAYRAGIAFARWFDTQIHDAHKIPGGRALLVSNHAFVGIDSIAFVPALHLETGRIARALGQRRFFDTPVAGTVLRQLGALPGRRDAAVRLLESDELVIVYPGGARDSMKGRGQQYQLLWDGRTGFADVAIRARAPIVPVAAIGPDDVFRVLTRRGVVPLGVLGPDRIPLFVPVPRRVPFRYWVGDPIDPQPDPVLLADRVRAKLADLIEAHR